MLLTLGISPCPNDTFIFDAIINGKIDTEGLSFKVTVADVEELNRRAFRREINMTKLSYYAFAKVSDHYQLLQAGSALGRENGPLLVGRELLPPVPDPLMKIAVPGPFTTANLLFTIFFPALQNKKEVLFSEIEESILRGETDAGVIIHESRFTFEKKGLKQMADLGQMWESSTGLPVPLGGIAIDKNLPLDVRQTMDRVMRKSVLFALNHPHESLLFVKQYARELDDEVISKHINLFVNEFTVDLGTEGKNAVLKLFDGAMKAGLIDEIHPDFLLKNT